MIENYLRGESYDFLEYQEIQKMTIKLLLFHKTKYVYNPLALSVITYNRCKHIYKIKVYGK